MGVYPTKITPLKVVSCANDVLNHKIEAPYVILKLQKWLFEGFTLKEGKKIKVPDKAKDATNRRFFSKKERLTLKDNWPKAKALQPKCQEAIEKPITKEANQQPPTKASKAQFLN